MQMFKNNGNVWFIGCYGSLRCNVIYKLSRCSQTQLNNLAGGTTDITWTTWYDNGVKTTLILNILYQHKYKLYMELSYVNKCLQWYNPGTLSILENPLTRLFLLFLVELTSWTILLPWCQVELLNGGYLSWGYFIYVMKLWSLKLDILCQLVLLLMH